MTESKTPIFDAILAHVEKHGTLPDFGYGNEVYLTTTLQSVGGMVPDELLFHPWDVGHEIPKDIYDAVCAHNDGKWPAPQSVTEQLSDYERGTLLLSAVVQDQLRRSHARAASRIELD